MQTATTKLSDIDYRDHPSTIVFTIDGHPLGTASIIFTICSLFVHYMFTIIRQCTIDIRHHDIENDSQQNNDPTLDTAMHQN